uniref:Probable leucine-rich repeat receptor-like serine/threonine-protein kinase At3g14840 n=1 Tax=Tanacetum cinerariifolium TaxID=118510 RepID=A0A6L2KWI6_TANCI|nr:probable leucine-rich repeat receptor-like serine/threonine-protein kinase At3g14840 [Tanacetum cinerariifolium]
MSVVGVLSNCQIFRRQPAAKFAHRHRYMPKMCRISGNSLSGKIPEFIGKWNNLDSLRIQASGLEGPIPSSITLLRTLTDLQISDLNGPDTLCPPFISTTSFKNLILRSCNLIGNLPESLSASKVLET